MRIVYGEKKNIDVFEIIKKLNGCAFKVWLFLYERRPQELSPRIVREELNIKRTSYYTVQKELIENGMLAFEGYDFDEPVYSFHC